MKINWAKFRKAIVAGVGFAATAATAALAQGDLIPESNVKYVLFFVSLVTLAGVYRVPNQKPTTPVIEA
jgi:hypothetical protein